MGTDEAILLAVGEEWTKVAMVIVKAAATINEHLPDGDERYEVIAQRIEALIADGRLTAQGNVSNWRSSEVRRVR